MTDKHRILVIDDTPHNVKLLVDLLGAKGYEVRGAANGEEGLKAVESFNPDLVLLDVVMPGMSGYDVCRRLRAIDATRLLPVVMVTALDPSEERIKGIEAGADDFLTKPIQSAELLARVRSLLRIRTLHKELENWGRTLEQRVQAQLEKLGKLERLTGFFSPQVAEAIEGNVAAVVKPHRRKVSVVFLDLRGFTAFAETAEPEEMIEVLAEYHAEMGQAVTTHGGTLERFTGDGLMIFFNDPVEVPDHEARAVRMAVEMRDRFQKLRENWSRRGHQLELGIGIDTGYATLGVIGFEGRQDYAALGTVTNHAARLCGEAEAGQILVSDRLLARVENLVKSEPVGEKTLKGFHQGIITHNIVALTEQE